MHSGATQLDRAQAGLGGTQLAAAIAGAGFVAYQAHPDNALAATLIGGSALAARDGLRPAARRDVLRAGLRSMNCAAERGSVFLRQAAELEELEEAASGAALGALLVRQLAGSAQGDAAARERLDAALERLDAALLAARTSIGATRDAPAQVNETRRLIERNIERRLDALPIDYAAIIAAIGKLAPAAPNPPATPDGDTPTEALVRLGGDPAPAPALLAAGLNKNELARLADFSRAN